MEKIVKAQRQGSGSISLPLTPFITIGKYYHVKKVGEEITIHEVKE